MFGTGFVSGWGAMDQTIRGQQDFQLRREEMDARQKLQAQEFAFREKQFQFQQQSEARRSRLEAARMFNEMIQYNPNATAEDLAGIAAEVGFSPGRSSLENMANYLADKRRQAEQDRQFQALERQLRLQSVTNQAIGELASTYSDPTEAYDAWTRRAGPLAGTMTPQDFTAIFSRSQNDFLMKNLPLAKAMAASGQPLATQFPGASKGLLNALQAMADKESEKERAEALDKAVLREDQRLANALATGATDFTPAPSLPPELQTEYSNRFKTAIERNAAATLLKFQSDVASSADYSLRVRGGDVDTVRAEIADNAKSAIGRALTPDEVDQIMARLKSRAIAEQSVEYSTAYSKAQGDAITAATDKAKTAVETAKDFLGNKENAKAIFGGDKRGDQIRDAFQSLIETQGLVLTPEQVAGAGQLLAQDERIGANGTVSSSDILAAMQRNPVLKPVIERANPTAFRNEAVKSRLEASGLFQPNTLADDYVRSEVSYFTNNIEAGAKSVESEVSKVLTNQNLNAAMKKTALENKVAEIAASRQQVAATLNARLQASQRWVRPGTRPFTQDDAAKILAAFDQAQATNLEILRRGIATAERDVGRPSTVPPASSSQAPPALQSREDIMRRELGVEMPANMRARELDRIRAEREQAAEAEAKIAATRRAQQDQRFQELATQLQDPNLPAEERTRLLQEINRIIDAYR